MTEGFKSGCTPLAGLPATPSVNRKAMVIDRRRMMLDGGILFKSKCTFSWLVRTSSSELRLYLQVWVQVNQNILLNAKGTKGPRFSQQGYNLVILGYYAANVWSMVPDQHVV